MTGTDRSTGSSTAQSSDTTTAIASATVQVAHTAHPGTAEPVPAFLDLHPTPADLVRLVRDGLRSQPKQLPAWLLYDQEGSRLFERICEQPEYSLTRTETALLRREAGAIAAALGPGVVLVEFGAGNARKVGPLLQALQPQAYAALDISREHLAQACAALRPAYPATPVLGICCDYSAMDTLPLHPWLQGRRVGFYPGSSIGNFSPADAETLLRQFARLLGRDGQLLIGIDQPKAVTRLEAAYNDAAGYSAAFALNLLHRLNRDLDGDFNPEAFRYRARWQAEHSRIEMALVSKRHQTVHLQGEPWSFNQEEALISEYSVKYNREAFVALAARAGWQARRHWADPDGDLGLHWLVQAD